MLSPGDARDHVVVIVAALVRQPRQIQPGNGGEVDQILSLRSGVEKEGLRPAFLRGLGTELRHRAAAGHRDDMKVFLIWPPVGEARLPSLEQKDLPVLDRVEKGLGPVDGLRHEIDHRKIEREPLPPAEGDQLRDVETERDGVIRMTQRREEFIDRTPVPAFQIDLGHRPCLPSPLLYRTGAEKSMGFPSAARRLPAG